MLWCWKRFEMDLNPFFSYIVTSIRFLSSVKSLMLKIRILTEAFKIFSTLVKFLSSMNPLILSKFWAFSEAFTSIITHIGFRIKMNFLMLPKFIIESEASAINDTIVGSSSWSITLLVGKSEFRRTLLLHSSNPLVLVPAEFVEAWSLARNTREFLREGLGGI